MQQELAEEEIREGNSFRARAVSFAKPNAEYLGNNYLSIFSTGHEESEKIDEAVEINAEQQEILEDIENYETLKKYSSEEEIKEIDEDISNLRLAYEYA